MSRRSPCASDPHMDHLPYVLRGSHILSPSSQNLDIGFDKISVPGPANPQPTRPHKFPNPAGTAMACASQPAETSGRSTQTYASNQLTQIPTSNDWGAWATLRRRCDVNVDARGGGPAPACVIGPKGPMDDPPEGGPLRAGTVRLTVDFDGSFALSSNGLPTNWHGKSSVEYGQCLTHISASNLPPNRRVRQIKHRIRPVPDSHLHPIRLPTSGFAVEPEGSTYNRPWRADGTCINANDGIGTARIAD